MLTIIYIELKLTKTNLTPSQFQIPQYAYTVHTSIMKHETKIINIAIALIFYIEHNKIYK